MTLATNIVRVITDELGPGFLFRSFLGMKIANASAWQAWFPTGNYITTPAWSSVSFSVRHRVHNAVTSPVSTPVVIFIRKT